jgi:predicted metal-dependent hydrolase
VHGLKITIRPFSGVNVIYPHFVSFETAGKFVEDKMGWIRSQQEKIKKYESRVTLFREDTEFRTRDHVLSLGTHEKSTIQAIIRNQVIRINYPVYANVEDPRIQRVIRRAIHAALKLEAVRYLPALTDKLAREHGFSYGMVTVRNNKTRWGSCSGKDRISLNIHMMRLPPHLQEYIILHELCHTVHRHHQKPFWQLLDKLTGDRARKLDRELNAFNPETF